jgi:hypothetical protein
MEESSLRVSNKELFYSAMMMNFDRLVNIEYDFPADEKKLAAELEEVKGALRRRHLLKENSKGEITIDFALSACTAFCAKPDNCMVVDEKGFYATIYGAAGSYMLMERGDDGEYLALWFPDRESADGYITGRLENISNVSAEEGEAGGNGGA